jgi:hypothetical protein
MPHRCLLPVLLDADCANLFAGAVKVDESHDMACSSVRRNRTGMTAPITRRAALQAGTLAALAASRPARAAPVEITYWQSDFTPPPASANFR